MLQFLPVKTRPMLPPQDDIYPVLDKYLPSLKEGDVLIITSKIVSIHQGRCIKITDVREKDDLIKKEADAYIERVECPGGYVVLTIKGHTLAASAGIDESNANGHYVLWPRNINHTAKEIRNYLRAKFHLKKIAVIISDSRSMPLRYGAVGVAIGAFGLRPIRDYRKTFDIFGRELKMSRANIVDALASAAALLMGEGNEQTPMVIARDLKSIEFTEADNFAELFMPYEEDIYYPLLKKFYARWKKKK
jgi:coenzyme F420-0:L-glutamate ligase